MIILWIALHGESFARLEESSSHLIVINDDHGDDSMLTKHDDDEEVGEFCQVLMLFLMTDDDAA